MNGPLRVEAVWDEESGCYTIEHDGRLWSIRLGDEKEGPQAAMMAFIFTAIVQGRVTVRDKGTPR